MAACGQPVLRRGIAFLIITLASIALPLTNGFIGEFLILIGAFNAAPWVVVSATFGLVLASVYSLIMIHRAHFGAPRSNEALPGLNNRELFMVLGLAVLLIGLGVYPQVVLDTSAASMQGVQQWLGAALSQLASTR